MKYSLLPFQEILILFFFATKLICQSDARHYSEAEILGVHIFVPTWFL